MQDLLDRINQLIEENRKLRQQVRTDRLTGLYNERALLEFVSASRHDGWYVFCDMNGMKRINDTLGHAAADKYIQEFGVWLFDHTRNTRDRIGCDAISVRKHGDEFVVWTTNRRAARAISRRVNKWASNDGNVTVSAGIGRTMRDADAAMYRNKQQQKAAS